MKSLSICLVAIFFLASCAANKATPDWIDSFEYNPAYFSSLVKVRTNQPGYREQARDIAASEIAMQISTVVESDIRLTQSEVMGIPGSEYVSQIRSFSDARLKELVPVHTHESGGFYYVLYRLRKAEYYAQRTKQKDLAVSGAAELLSQYDLHRANPAIAIPHLVSALNLISPFLDMELYIQDTDLAAEVYSRLHQLPGLINYKWNHDVINAKAKVKDSLILEGSAWLNDSSNPVVNLPFKAISSTISINNPVFTDSQGSFNFVISRIENAEPEQSVDIGFDRDYYLDLISNPAARKIWQSINFSTSRIRVAVQKPMLFLEYAYISGFQSGYRDTVSGAIAGLGMGTTSQLPEADYILRVRVEVTGGEYLNSMRYYTALSEIRLSLIEAKSGATLNYLEHSNLKSGGNSREAAERNAERDAAKLIGDTLLYRLLYQELLK